MHFVGHIEVATGYHLAHEPTDDGLFSSVPTPAPTPEE
jgi:hypothetical protein